MLGFPYKLNKYRIFPILDLEKRENNLALIKINIANLQSCRKNIATIVFLSSMRFGTYIARYNGNWTAFRQGREEEAETALFFADNFLPNKARTKILPPSCFSRQCGSKHILDDLISVMYIKGTIQGIHQGQLWNRELSRALTTDHTIVFTFSTKHVQTYQLSFTASRYL